MQNVEIKKYEIFRLGPDPYFIGYTALLLIPEIIGLSITGISNDSIFSKLPFWILTCMVITMFASLITGIVFVNHKNDEKKFKITPLLIIASVIGITYAIVASIAFAMYGNTIFPLISMIIGFGGLTLLNIQRRNWISCIFSITIILFLIIGCTKI